MARDRMPTMPMTSRYRIFATALMLLACAEDAPTGRSQRARDGALAPAGDRSGVELAPGARGAEVASLQSYLTRFGYFSNHELTERYHDWRPIVDDTPEPGTYDDVTAEAVKELQRRSGLPDTGVVDAATRDLLKAPRCGVPDRRAPEAKVEKFAFGPNKWAKRNLTWKFVDNSYRPSWMNVSTIRGVISFAYFLWSLETDLNIVEASSGRTDITVQFGAIDGRSNAATGTGLVLAEAQSPRDAGSLLTFDYQEEWSFDNVTIGATATDLAAVALHEAGHTLGLGHSSSLSGPTPVMFAQTAAGVLQRELMPDDVAAISTLYDLWNPVAGVAQDLAMSPGGSVWHIGTAPVGDGFRIYKWGFNGWEEASGNGGAVRIAVAPDERAWVVTRGGGVFWHGANHREGGWTQVTGLCATDIGIGRDGSMWFVTCTRDTQGPEGGFRVGRLTVVGLTATTAAIGIQEAVGSTHATRISVAPDGSPWIVNTLGDVYRSPTKDPNNPAWVGFYGVKAADISITPDSFVYVTGAGPNAGAVFIRNDQDARFNTNDVHQWHQLSGLSGGAAQIAAGRRVVWVSGSNGAIHRQTAKTFGG